MRGKRLVIRDDLSAAELRRRARREPDRAAARMQAIANALEGMTRGEAARLAGMERQALRDAVLRYNAEGIDGLHDRPRPGARPRLDAGQMQQLRQIVLSGPDVEASGLSAWTLGLLCEEVERRWGVRYHEGHLSKLMRKLGLSRQKSRPSHPKAEAAAREAFEKATVLSVKRRFGFSRSCMARGASRLARRATAFGGFGLDPPRAMPVGRLIGLMLLPLTRIAIGCSSA
jgi:transposase